MFCRCFGLLLSIPTCACLTELSATSMLEYVCRSQLDHGNRNNCRDDGGSCGFHPNVGRRNDHASCKFAFSRNASGSPKSMQYGKQAKNRIIIYFFCIHILSSTENCQAVFPAFYLYVSGPNGFIFFGCLQVLQI